MTDEPKVIPLRIVKDGEGESGGPPVKQEPYYGTRCSMLGDFSHEAIVDVKLRRVTCKQCEETLDPIEVLLECVKYFQVIQWKLDTIREHEKKDRQLSWAKMRRNKRTGTYENSRGGYRIERSDGGWTALELTRQHGWKPIHSPVTLAQAKALVLRHVKLHWGEVDKCEP